MQVKWNHNSIEKLQLPQAFSTLFFYFNYFSQRKLYFGKTEAHKMMNAIYSLQTEEKHLAGLSFMRKKCK